MLRQRIRNGIKRRLEKVVDRVLGPKDGHADSDDRPVDVMAPRPAPEPLDTPEAPPAAAKTPPAAAKAPPAAAKAPPAAAKAPPAAAVEEPRPQEVEAHPEDVEAHPEEVEAHPEEVEADLESEQRPITMEAVQEIFDEMVRPALQADGGDIALLDVKDDRIYVKLVGACSTCPSSIATMKMGIEALLQEEFPQMQELIQVDGAVA